MVELNYESLLKLVQEGNVSEVESLLNVSNDEILGAIGYGKYDEVFETALAANNPDMMKLLLKHSNLITPVSIESAVNDDTQNKLNPQLKSHLKEYLSAINRSNMQKRDFGEWQTELKRAQEQGFNDLADRIQRRLDFEAQGRQEMDQKLPEGTILNRWKNEKSWIVDGMGRLEYDLYGQKNGDEIVKVLADMGIKAQFDAHEQATGGVNDYRITVDTKDAIKLKEQLKQNKGENMVKKTTTEVKYDDAEFKKEQMKKAARLNPDIIFKAKREKDQSVEYDDDGNIVQREFDKLGRKIRSVHINPKTGKLTFHRKHHKIV